MATMLQSASLAALAGIRHGFFTRAGGVSTGCYESLNAGIGSDDRPEHVFENRARMAALGTPVRSRLMGMYIVSGVLAGAAGAVAAQSNGIVALDSLGFALSAESLVMLILGGAAKDLAEAQAKVAATIASGAKAVKIESKADGTGAWVVDSKGNVSPFGTTRNSEMPSTPTCQLMPQSLIQLCCEANW